MDMGVAWGRGGRVVVCNVVAPTGASGSLDWGLGLVSGLSCLSC